MSALEDEDVATAILAKWNGDGADASLTQLVPGGLTRGELTPLQPGTDPEEKVARLVPYAGLEVKQGPIPNKPDTGGAYIDNRHATISIYGPKPAVADALRVARTVFIRKTLAVPNVVAFMACLSIDEECGLFEEKLSRAGERIWKGVLALHVMTHRRY